MNFSEISRIVTTVMLNPDFYKTKSLKEMTDEEWEALCDGCGKCCFRKFIEGRGKNEKLYYTRIACNHLDLSNCSCTVYENRFKLNRECIHLTKKNLPQFKWLPDTCAYRLLWENKELPQWHPLVSGNKNSVKNSGILFEKPVHENEINEDDWFNYVINSE